MARLGLFEPAPRLAAGVSGGADSMALALLADGWARERGGSLLALIVDHGLRAASVREAEATATRLAERGIATRRLAIEGLALGPALAERARTARLHAMEVACAAAGIVHLLLGHHAADQAETILIRALGGSGEAGLAGMAPLREMSRVRILRPLLAMPPRLLRSVLEEAGVGWVDDPSNVDRAALRPRLRLLRRDRGGEGAATAALVAAAETAARHRAAQEGHLATVLAQQAILRPEGFALLGQQAMDAGALAALLQAVSGSPFPPASASLKRLAASPVPATLAGARLLPAGRLGDGLLLVREAAAMAPPVPATSGAVWDRRFRLGRVTVPANATLGALGADASRLRRNSPLPSAVLQTLPALRVGGMLLAVPHLFYPDRKVCEYLPVLFSPPRPVAAAPFGFWGCTKRGDTLC